MSESNALRVFACKAPLGLTTALAGIRYHYFPRRNLRLRVTWTASCDFWQDRDGLCIQAEETVPTELGSGALLTDCSPATDQQDLECTLESSLWLLKYKCIYLDSLSACFLASSPQLHRASRLPLQRPHCPAAAPLGRLSDAPLGAAAPGLQRCPILLLPGPTPTAPAS